MNEQHSADIPPAMLQNLLAVLDAMEQGVLCISTAGKPLFLNSRGAELLEISGRVDLAEHEETLAPLLEVGRSLVGSSRHANSQTLVLGGKLKGSSAFGSFNEITLTSSRGRAYSALAYAQFLDCPPSGEGGNSLSGALVCFYDLTYLEPFFRTIAQSRRNRAMIVLASAFSGRALLISPSGQDIISSYEKAEEEYFRSSPGTRIDLVETDLLPGLTTAVDIVDPLVVTTSKFLIDVKTSALLKISQPNFIRILCHLLLEAADFVGPFGTTLVQASILKDRQSEVENAQSESPRPALEMKITAERKTVSSSRATPLELYLYQRYMPIHYKVKVVGSAGERANPIYELQLGADLHGSDQFLSENLRIASHIARQCGVSLRVVRDEEQKLGISVEFLLRTELAK